MPESLDIIEIRRAVQALCAEFPGEYWRAKDSDRAYPGEFVDALAKAWFLATMYIMNTLLKYGRAALALPKNMMSNANSAKHGFIPSPRSAPT
jgi:acyl-CoA dehydrogenase